MYLREDLQWSAHISKFNVLLRMCEQPLFCLLTFGHKVKFLHQLLPDYHRTSLL